MAFSLNAKYPAKRLLGFRLYNKFYTTDRLYASFKNEHDNSCLKKSLQMTLGFDHLCLKQ